MFSPHGHKSNTHHPLSLLAGYQQAVSLPRALGRQPLLFRWTAGPHLPAMPHLCALHPVSFHPSTSLLRPFGGFPGPLSLGGQRAWQVRTHVGLSYLLPPFLSSFVYMNSCKSNPMKSSKVFTLLQFLFFNVSVSVPRAVIHQARVTGVTNRPWPRLFRSTRTPCAPCTLPESTQPQGGVGETPLMKHTTPCCLTVSCR